MGERIGATMLTKTRSLPLIIGVGFLLGFLITISEPDLQVLANQVPSIPNMTLILLGSGRRGRCSSSWRFCVCSSASRCRGSLWLFYSLIFVLAALRAPKSFWPSLLTPAA